MRFLSVLLVTAALIGCAGDESSDVPDAVETTATSGRVFTTDALLARFPAEVADLPQGATSGETDGALGFEVTRATASYTENIDRLGPIVVLNVLDLGSATMADRMGYGWGISGGTPDTTFDSHAAQIMPQTAGGKTKVSVLVGDRFLIEANGEGVTMEVTEQAVRALDLPVLERLADE